MHTRPGVEAAMEDNLQRDRDAERETPAVEPTAPLPWPVVPIAVPLLYLWIAWSWWGETRTQLEALPEVAPGGATAAMAAAAVATRIPSLFAEAGAYVLWWRSRGLRLPFWRFLCSVATLSTCDLFGLSIRHAIEHAPNEWRLIGAVLAGPATLDPTGAHATGAAAAFGNFGALTAARVVMTAWAQARGIGRPIAGPLLVTVLAWLVTRLVAWWSVDLVRGLSPLP